MQNLETTSLGEPAEAAGDRTVTVPSRPDAEPRRTDRIGPYVVVGKLGEGGMGTVYLAEQTWPLHRRVALKVIRNCRAGQSSMRRFEMERSALERMSHPNVAQVFDTGVTAERRPYFVMEYVRGSAITTYCDRHRLSLRQRLRLYLGVCEGVQHAHQKGIIHRDLKPSNVLVTELGGSRIAKIIDFGVAKALDAPAGPNTVTGDDLVGTPAYLSPEAIRPSAPGDFDADTRTDVYSLGVLLYELTVGALPFEGGAGGVLEVLRKIAEEDAEKPSCRLDRVEPDRRMAAAAARGTDTASLRRTLRGDLDWIILKAMAKRRDERYSSVAELAADLGRHLRQEPVLAGPPGTGYRLRKFLGRHRGAVAAACLSTLALLAGIVATTASARRAGREAVRANQEARAAVQVADFMVDLFRISDPGDARGNSITAREILDAGAARVRHELADQPLTRSRLMETIGRVYLRLGIYQQAEPLLEEAHSLRSGVLDEHHVEVARSLSHLAELHDALGDYQKARDLYREALAVRERVLGPAHVEVARNLAELASVHVSLGDPEEAGRLFERAIGIFTGAPDVSSDLAAAYNDFAGLYIERGDFAKAETFLNKAVALREAIFEPGHPDLAEAHNNLAVLALYVDDKMRSEGYFRQALAGFERAYGPDHPEVATVSLNLGVLYGHASRYEEALPLLAKAREIFEEKRPDHPRLASVVNVLGNFRARLGQYGEARELLRRALEIRRTALGPEHLYVALAYNDLAIVHRDLGDDEEARRLFRKALDFYAENLPPDHHEVARTLYELATVDRFTNRTDQAVASLERAVEIYGASLGPEGGRTIDAKRQLAEAYVEAGRLREAGELLHEALGAAREVHARNPLDRRAGCRYASVLVAFGGWYQASGNGEAAGGAWSRAVDLLQPLVAGSFEVPTAVSLVLALLRLGRVDEARPLAEELTRLGWTRPDFTELCRRHGVLAPLERRAAPRTSPPAVPNPKPS